MSVMDPLLAPPTAAAPPPPPAQATHRLEIHSEYASAVVPGWVVNLETFRAWVHSEAFPEQGRFAFLDGIIWGDLTMEEFVTHNLVKTCFNGVVFSVVNPLRLGYLHSDGALLTNPAANLSTEPDSMFCFWETVRSGCAKWIPGKVVGYMELEGTPDWVLEIVSRTSVKKDKAILPQLYWLAGVPEFWLVDVREAPAEFNIYRHGASGYEPQPVTEKGIFSPIFGKHFRLAQEMDPLGQPSFQLLVET